jgi:methionine-rich copper-binding protein CopC
VETCITSTNTRSPGTQFTRHYHLRLVRRLVIGALVAVLTMLVTAPGAWAQAELTGSDPAEGAELARAPERITLTFSEPVDPNGSVVFVLGADGRTWQVGEITASGGTLTMPVTPSGPAGQCRVVYNIVGKDRPLSGEVRFTLTAPAPNAPPPTSVAEEVAEPDPITGEPENGVPMWVWILAGAIVFGVAVGLVVAGSTRARR